MDAYQEPYAITAQDIARLKTCDRAIFRYDRDKNESYVEAYKEADDKNPWEQRHRINVVTATRCYQGDLGDDYGCYEVYAAVDSVTRYKYDDLGTLGALIDLLKVGDKLTVEYMAGNNNQLLNDASLHHDMLYLIITRGTAEKPKRMRFIVDSRISLDNSARMCKVRRHIV